jgi:uncharacterized protein (TIGR00290 family)
VSGREKVLLAWSSGKDAAFALHLLRGDGVTVSGLLTTVNDAVERVSMHAVRLSLLRLQAEAVGLPLVEVRLPSPCSNRDYEAAMGSALARARDEGVRAVAFGDIFLEDVRRYREAKMEGTGLRPLFPLWGRDTRELAHAMIGAGLRAVLTCVDPCFLPADYAGRSFDAALVGGLPPTVDPCGERGEFHTFAWDGPGFQRPVAWRAGEIVKHEGFVFADVLPEARGEAA